ncbi:hypothetical protein L596_006448 [Steinernema carpocapsae]|uniref:Uncharacterized protein n=1 Tax=Steinernema carpocapsae TaxID=34508 RepID=A0A4U8V231_STECR|nr:hypothetical protein L596_006448 [Steinernema carpocapsae]
MRAQNQKKVEKMELWIYTPNRKPKDRLVGRIQPGTGPFGNILYSRLIQENYKLRDVLFRTLLVKNEVLREK